MAGCISFSALFVYGNKEKRDVLSGIRGHQKELTLV